MTPLLEEQLSTPKRAKLVRLFPVPTGGFGDAGQLADWVLFMLSDAADFLCGSIVFVDGGTDAYFRALAKACAGVSIVVLLQTVQSRDSPGVREDSPGVRKEIWGPQPVGFGSRGTESLPGACGPSAILGDLLAFIRDPDGNNVEAAFPLGARASTGRGVKHSPQG